MPAQGGISYVTHARLQQRACVGDARAPPRDEKGTTVHTTTHRTSSAPTPAQQPSPTPAELGVGARVTLSVMSSDYVRIITGALAQTPTDGLTVETDPVSTRVAGPEQRIAEYLSALVAAAGRSGEHVSASIMLSRGCPGEVTCDLAGGRALPAAPSVVLEATGVEAVAQWALYPLADQPLAGSGAPDHMRDIYAAIEQARAAGTVVGSDHYVTRLAGDVADILTTVVGAWQSVGRTVQHVTTHVTLSVNSPSLRGGADGTDGTRTAGSPQPGATETETETETDGEAAR
ncbi:YkoF family thiamine/hydroxymethylpyrimidine-binding protein [Sanguibacter sp. 4.1]|uniref:YkoF family thiamine/hydroxymethylpyrimidine-binding protein n=1 Tax=Sanguibacter biliveldensis TaxID=3030830 RepID=A0AAF1BZH8_9MICO|nr:YkoF family thiamine/hydroxymethylpyrimidine-binding protein [Sanguibacter sp. 4.1]WPF83132.1 YkoF family thiamine/hydroxymethylpyrimidine-binding protein [Sanguibacter sp. 4.1]